MARKSTRHGAKRGLALFLGRAGKKGAGTAAKASVTAEDVKVTEPASSPRIWQASDK
jgi:hypothetical protein